MKPNTETIQKATELARESSEVQAVVVWEVREVVVPFYKAVLRGDDLHATAYPCGQVKWLKSRRSEEDA